MPKRTTTLKKTALFLGLFLFLSIFQSVYAARNGGGSGGTDTNAPPIETVNIGDTGFDMSVLITSFFKVAFPIAIILGFLNIILAGYTLMTSEGDPRKTNEGKEKLGAAITGLLFVLLTIGILRIIIGTLIGGDGAGF